MRRNGHLLVSKQGERFACDRSDWSKYKYIEQRYNIMYDDLVKEEITSILDPPKYMNNKATIVQSIKEASGIECNVKILHPNHLLFSEETGCNSSQKEDGNQGG